MSDVFRFFQIRQPQKAAVSQVVSLGISTHVAIPVGPGLSATQQAMNLPFLLGLTGAASVLSPSGGTSTAKPAAPFYDRLRAAYDTGDVNQFIRVASDFFLTSAVHKLSDLLPISQAAYALFDGMGTIIQKPLIDNFFARYGVEDLNAYLQRDLVNEVGRVNDTILALEALRLHGMQRELSHTRLLKALYAVAIAYALRGRDVKNWTVAPLTSLFQMTIYVPGWVWQLDPCRRVVQDGSPAGAVATSPGAAAELAASPLIQQANAVSIYNEAVNQPPNEKLCECTCDDRCVPQSPCCAEVKSFITDLLIVRETLQCYLPADISYIENVLAGEKRIRKHDSLVQVQQTQVTDTTVTTSQELDHQVSTRFDLSNQTQKTIDTDSQFSAGLTANQSWGTGNATITANASMSTSVSTSEQTAQNYARDVVDRSVSTIQKSVQQLVSISTLNRTRDINTHVFDRTGQALTVGIYTWVNKTLREQVFSYGRRMVYEFILPEPAALYKALLIRSFGLDATFPGGAPPVAPPPATGITAANYLSLVNTYGVDDAPAPPDTTKTVTLDFSGDFGGEHWGLFTGWVYSGAHTDTGMISVPDGYAATSMSGSCGRNYNGRTSTAYVKINLGTNDLMWQLNAADIGGPVNLVPPLEGQLQSVCDTYNVTNYSAHLIVQCTVKADVLLTWQFAVHKSLVAAYQNQLDAYNTSLAAFNSAQADKATAMQNYISNRDPFYNREAERTELKRLAISWLTCQFFDQFNAMKQRVQPCGLPQMNLHQADEQGKIVRFWEQAIDWDLMTYLFYPYFWGRKCTWADKIAEDTGDGLFDKFMQAGSARVQVPVAEGFEDDMLYWENTGQIWGQDGEPPINDMDPHWVSMVQEIKHQQDCYLNDREGGVDTNPPSSVVTIKGSDRYWDPVSGAVDPNAVAADIDREISIDTVIYRIVAIALDPSSPSYNALNPDSMWWDVTLDRPYEGAAATGLPYAVGAKYVGAPWIVTVPTDLIWLKNDTYCLPCYPVTCKGP